MNDKTPITVLDGAVRLHQPEGGFRTSIDAVLLAAACPAHSGEHILDLGCGVGSAGICVLKRINDTTLTGLEIQKSHVRIAKDNAQENSLSQRCVFVQEDMRNFSQTPYDHVICNPPYEEAGKHLHSPSAAKARAIGHVDNAVTVEDWIKCAFRCVKSGGSLTLIHKADHIQTILRALGKSWGAVEVIPLWPKADRPAKRVVIRALKHRKSPSTLHPGLVLHKNDGQYTQDADRILRDIKALYP